MRDINSAETAGLYRVTANKNEVNIYIKDAVPIVLNKADFTSPYWTYCLKDLLEEAFCLSDEKGYEEGYKQGHSDGYHERQEDHECEDRYDEGYEDGKEAAEEEFREKLDSYIVTDEGDK